MSAAREAILGALRDAAGRGEPDDARRKAVANRLAARRRGTIPARGKLERAGLIDLFIAEAVRADATVARVRRAGDVPGAVADHLKAQNLPAQIRMAPDSRLDAYPWDRAPMLAIERGIAGPQDEVTLTGAFAAIAESGTLMLASGPDSPTTLNFLPDQHIVVLRADEIVGAYEDGWDRLREAGSMPRTVNFITGPSRTADIEQTLQVGIHGPRHLHIVLVEDESPGGPGSDG